MQVIRSFAALAFSASAVAAQVPNPSRADSTSARIAIVGDSIRLSRREAVAEALAHNPQLEIARAIIGEARARKVEAVSIPDPAVTASLDQSKKFLVPDLPASGMMKLFEE